MRDLYAEVTNKIIASLEAGVAPWIKPWTVAYDPIPLNAGSRRPYRGINTLLLSLQAGLSGYEANAWLTYRQASELGAQVRGGERSTLIVFYKLRELGQAAVAETQEDVPQPKVVPMLRAYHVFNVAQIDGLPAGYKPAPVVPSWSPLEAAERLLQASGATLSHGGAEAYYSPLDDRIQLPAQGAFKDRASYYGTALHELVHWSGHPERLNRVLSVRFGAEAYIAEELVAEMGSAFLSAQCGIEGRLQHASYIADWLKVLRSDKRAVFTAATKAQQAADYLQGLTVPAPTQPAELAEAA